MDKPDVVFVHYSSSPGGIEVTLPQISVHLPQFSFSAFVIRPHPEGAHDVYSGRPVSLNYGSVRNLPASIRMFRYAARYRKAVFHVFNIGPFFLLILRMAGVRRLIYSIHGTQYWKGSVQRVFLRVLWRLSLSRRYVVTANSEFSKKVFLDNVIAGREVKVLYNPIDHDRFRLSEGKIRSGHPQRIIYCGRLDKEKNLDEWIRIAAIIGRNDPDVTFEIYGDGSERSHLEELMTKNGISDRVFLKGYTEKPEKVMKEADLLMFLSSYESFGNVVVESILCGTPVIAVDIPAMKEIFRDFPEFLVSRDSIIEESILLRLQDFDKLNRSALAARENFMMRFGPQAHFDTLAVLYKDLIKTR